MAEHQIEAVSPVVQLGRKMELVLKRTLDWRSILKRTFVRKARVASGNSSAASRPAASRHAGPEGLTQRVARLVLLDCPVHAAPSGRRA